ncbi:hypothetical protein SAMD00019534_067920 [Acytostelium subglobosum LB1]|uniref:hypothetical protein n=1 Tax=Acytostelium subglobosum LB1 TaxID=1410327 RepID=UPI000644A972|nr:hypothetical protein SAMD00019534_067920 [Acytostelium subglobosum LB1]GAM23617.1 hypothetical protein SAMD00019534_067920 [Acytostelium subglobosum LB1]|eukprot:XP_012753358.1 hypothetical protein SAMD00019534_067920 [Acytostelium subglobosum LB1]
MHLGGLRTALFNYLFAKKHNGSFILRIEDTDRTRLVEGSAQNLDDCLAWAGIPYDEGPKRPLPDTPSYVQSERLNIYKEHAKVLLDSGAAYHCFCTAERLEAQRALSKNKGPVQLYDRSCLKLTREEVERRLQRGDSHTVRLRIPHERAHTKFTDIVKGNVQFLNQQIDDQILMKSDGFPTYHLASVVDDHLMRISHVIRGEEWLNSTPKHIILYEAFGWKPPHFAHVPLLLNSDKSKLSKRQGDVSVDSYINKGYLPQALVNFVALLGWSPSDTTKEVFTLDELIESIKEKLSKSLEGNVIIDDQYLKRAIHCVKERIHVIDDCVSLLRPFFMSADFSTEQAKAMRQKVWHGDRSVNNVKVIMEELSSIDGSSDNFTAENIYQSFQRACQIIHPDSQTDKERTTKTNQLMSQLRYLLNGSPSGGGVPLTIEILGKDKALVRLTEALALAHQAQ